MDILKVNSRSRVIQIIKGETYQIKKIFNGYEDCFENERIANVLFKDFPWMSVWISEGEDYFIREYYPEGTRLDNISIFLTESEKKGIAGQILEAILDMYSLGYSHRDIHAQNVFVINNKIKLIDFEVMGRNKTANVGFISSYDITGKGMESPYQTSNMCFVSDHPLSICKILDVNLSDSIQELENILKQRLEEVTKTFQTVSSRYTTKLGKIYSSFCLPAFSIDPNFTQRDNSMRLDKFNIKKSDISYKSVLDLGCNAGGMLFELQKFSPSACLGIEYDIEKVRLANKIAAYTNLRNVVFQQGDIDNIDLDEFCDGFDVVLCLAIEAHLKNKQNLFQLLGKLTKGILLFEGNAGTDIEKVKESLRDVGFNNIEDFGFCNDDALEENNCRPLLKAYK